MKKTIRLNESELHQMIGAAVKQVLIESSLDWGSPERDLGNGGFSEESLLNQSYKRVEQGLLKLGFELEEYGDDENGNGVVYFSHPNGMTVGVTYPWEKTGRDSYRAGKISNVISY